MRRGFGAAAICLLLIGCSGHEPLPVSTPMPPVGEAMPVQLTTAIPPTTSVHAAAVEHVLRETQLSAKELVYVAGPRPEEWDPWCGFDPAPRGCSVLARLAAATPFVSEEGRGAEIVTAFAPIDVEFVTDPLGLFEPMAEGTAQIRGGAGLVTFGVEIQVDRRRYLPVGVNDGTRAVTWLFEASAAPADPMVGYS